MGLLADIYWFLLHHLSLCFLKETDIYRITCRHLLVLIVSFFILFLRRNGHLWDYLQTFTGFLSQTT